MKVLKRENLIRERILKRERSKEGTNVLVYGDSILRFIEKKEKKSREPSKSTFSLKIWIWNTHLKSPLAWAKLFFLCINFKNNNNEGGVERERRNGKQPGC